MEFTSSNNRVKVIAILRQIETAIAQLKQWNEHIKSADDYYDTPEGMQKLAADCMLIEAIGESVNQIDKITKGSLLPIYPDIPWSDVIGIRNHIAHGYFDIDADVIFNTIKNDIEPLLNAVIFLRSICEKHSY